MSDRAWGTAFGAESYFNRLREGPTTPPAPAEPPRTVTSGYQGDLVEIRTGQLRSWYHELDDALAEIEDGTTRGLTRGVQDLEALRDRIDDVIRSAHGSARANRPAR